MRFAHAPTASWRGLGSGRYATKTLALARSNSRGWERGHTDCTLSSEGGLQTLLNAHLLLLPNADSLSYIMQGIVTGFKSRRSLPHLSGSGS